MALNFRPFDNKRLSPDTTHSEALLNAAMHVFASRPGIFRSDLRERLEQARHNHAERSRKVEILTEQLENLCCCMWLGSSAPQAQYVQDQLAAELDARDWWGAVANGMDRIIKGIESGALPRPTGFIDHSPPGPRDHLSWRAL